MLSLGSLAFLAPWLLAALLALPVIWWLLRATPPAPRRQRFAGVRLLLGLEDPERMPERTPWWLLLLRIAALAAAIVALAEPVLNPEGEASGAGDGTLLVVLDDSWGAAPDWPEQMERLDAILREADRNARPVVLVRAASPLTDGALEARPARAWLGALDAFEPQPWSPDRAALADALAGLEASDVVWLTDGVGADAGLGEALNAIGPVAVLAPVQRARALTAPLFVDGEVRAEVLRVEPGEERRRVSALGPDPNGVTRVLGQAEAVFEGEATRAEVAFDLPLELVNRVTRLTLDLAPSAGGSALADDALRRRSVGLVAGAGAAETIRLLDPLHYLRTALAPTSDMFELPLSDLLPATPDVIILADVGTLSRSEADAVEHWVEAGGLLIRFAGPRLAASGLGQIERDPLLPVRLRAGGRSVGGAMSWGAPKRLRPFAEDGAFAGLTPPAEVEITSQVMAQPDPDLADLTLAALEDGTPLVTARGLGQGRVVLFHVTASADWSTLPLSGLFVQVLDRLTQTTRPGASDTAGEDIAGLTWVADTVLDGFGRPISGESLAGVPGDRLAQGQAGPGVPPGVYRAGERSVALNLFAAGDTLEPLPLPAGATLLSFEVGQEQRFTAPLLAIALLLLLIDALATLALNGRLLPRARRVAPLLVAGCMLIAQDAPAQTPDERAAFATADTVLAYVLTGDAALDAKSEAGMRGLALTLTQRTSVEPLTTAVDLERDELAFYPMLYWPISEGQATPSDEAYTRLNRFLRNGGLILFDTADANLGGFSIGTPNGRALRRLAAPLDLPPLELAPEDHVLTRTYYLLRGFPGRFTTGETWVEAAPDVVVEQGMPFRQLNDGVTPVLIGSNDYAAAWAVDEAGRALYPVGRGSRGERQREIARRFGVNIVMYVLTGNYKSDQVHVPALLERLGQ